MSMSNNEETLVVLFLYALLFAAIIGGLCLFKYVSCHSKASMQEMECSYNPLQGCMVKVDGKWIDYDRLRVME